MRIPHSPPRTEVADKITLIAQKYAGALVGYEYRQTQQSPSIVQTDPKLEGIHINKNKPWKEPVVVSDGCVFCEKLTDDSAVKRVAGFQHQIDIEVLRSHQATYMRWLLEDVENVPVTAITQDNLGHDEERGVLQSPENRRKFIELHQIKEDWSMKAFPLVALPLKLKRKMCIEWNHVYRDYLKEHEDIIYDFNKKMFFVILPDLEPCDVCQGIRTYDEYGNVVSVHSESCENALSTELVNLDMQARLIAALRELHGF